MGKLKKIIGVYKIQSRLHPRWVYIGSSISCINRKHQHIATLKRGKGMPKLQAHVDIFGIKDLQFTVIEECDISQLAEREFYYINKLNPFFNSTNNTSRHYRDTKVLFVELKRNKYPIVDAVTVGDIIAAKDERVIKLVKKTGKTFILCNGSLIPESVMSLEEYKQYFKVAS